MHTIVGAGRFLAVVLSDTMVAAVNDAGVLWRWHLADARPIGDPIGAQEAEIQAMDATVFGGRTLAVTGDGDGVARIWDLTRGVAVGAPLRGHAGRITAVTATQVAGRPVAVTGGRDGVVRVWELTP